MAIHACQYAIFPFIRVNFRYTDNASELCYNRKRENHHRLVDS